MTATVPGRQFAPASGSASIARHSLLFPRFLDPFGFGLQWFVVLCSPKRVSVWIHLHRCVHGGRIRLLLMMMILLRILLMSRQHRCTTRIHPHARIHRMLLLRQRLRLHGVRERLPKRIVPRSTNGVTRVISMGRIKFLRLSGRLNRWPIVRSSLVRFGTGSRALFALDIQFF